MNHPGIVPKLEYLEDTNDVTCLLEVGRQVLLNT